MIIAKYNLKKARAGIVISETIVNNLVEQAEQAVVQKAQEVAVETTSTIAMTATVNANGELIMVSDMNAAVQEAEART